jgi:hypothetical protein
MTSRIFIDIIIFFSIFYFPWWITTIFVIGGIFLFRNFYEAIFAGFLLDALYGAKTVEFYGFWFVFAASFFLFYIIVNRLKKNIRFYNISN